jgi:FkbM family methyltransferase
VNTLQKLAKRLEWAEHVVPGPWRLAARYHVQRLVRALEPEMRLLGRLLEQGGVAIDAGANWGIYTYALARSASVVHCFEPLAECCAYIRAMRAPNVVVHGYALADQEGVLRLHIPISGGRSVRTRASVHRPAGSFDVRDVEVRTLDSFAFDRVDFIKIDVEGHEEAALRGASATLDRHRPRLLLEIDRNRHSQQSVGALIDWLARRAYAPYVLGSSGLRRSTDPWADTTAHVNFIFAADDLAGA